MSNLLRSLDATLASLERNYPRGLPRRIVEKVRQENARGALFALIVDDDSNETLVKNLVEKGLKTSLAEVVRCVASESGLKVISGSDQEPLKGVSKLLCFGPRSEVLARSLSYIPATALFLPPLEEIARDPAVKKRVWQEIKPLVE